MKPQIQPNSSVLHVGVRANFSDGGAEPSLPEKYFDSDRKTAHLACYQRSETVHIEDSLFKIAFPDSPHPIISF